MMTFFWSIVAFFLLGVLLWLIFWADDDAVLRTMRIPADGDADGDGDVDAHDQAAADDSLSAPVRVAAMEAKYEAGADIAAASAAVAEAAEASMSGDAQAAKAAQEAADAALAEAGDALDRAGAALDATTDTASGSAVEAREELKSLRAAQTAAVAAAETSMEEAADAANAAEADVAPAVRSSGVDLDILADAGGNYPDNLTKVDGIGEVYQQRLYAAGVYTWSQLADIDVAALEARTEAIEAANVAEWPAQAKALAAANDRVGARYEGPTPDRLVILPGVGEGAQDVMRHHGLVTFAQIVDADPSFVAAVLKAGGSRADADEVIAAAKELLAKSA